MTAPLLTIEGVYKRFGGVQAVQGVDLSVSPGELVGLFGPNGAGKTTLFNLIAGVFPPDKGRIVLDGRDISRLPSFRRAEAGIGRTFQVCRPFRTLSVADNVRAAMRLTDVEGSNEAGQIDSILRAVGLRERAKVLAANLTLGMLKRLEVARALALSPKVFLLDEPLAGLTGGETTEFLDFIRGLNSHAAVVLVDHNVRQTLRMCDRAVVMDAGAVIAAGSPEQIRADARVHAAYLGQEPT
jgi:branched-chain amino acid transport system ATP-binding protein